MKTAPYTFNPEAGTITVNKLQLTATVTKQAHGGYTVKLNGSHNLSDAKAIALERRLTDWYYFNYEKNKS